jgi:hypothetical protein
VLLEDKLYYAVHGYGRPTHTNTSFIYSITTDLKGFKWFAVPTHGMREFTLSTYHSQLVLVGGRTNDGTISNGVWVRERGRSNWLQSLPPMSIPRYRAGAVNVKNPEYLIVAGGNGSERSPVDTVEVLIEGQWFFLQSFPQPRKLYTDIMNPVVHNGSLFLMDCYGTYYCRFKSLLTSCLLAKSGGLDRDAPLWNTMPSDHCSDPGVFGRQLVAMNVGTGSIHAYSSISQSWAHVEHFPRSKFFSESAIVTPTGELVLIGISGLLKGVLKS